MTTINYFQDDVSTAIKDFTGRKITSAEFKAKLSECEVKVDDHINKMILKHQAGDSVSYNAFGTYIFRQLNGRGAINTVDKITRNDVQIVGVEKV
jgi:hypothetical protein